MFLHYLDLSWRSFKRTPLISLMMVLAIAIGIGVTMTSLSVYHMMSMDPIPQKSSQLYAVQLQIMDDGNTWRTEDDLPYQLTYQDAYNLQQAEFDAPSAAMLKSGFSVHLNDPDFSPFVSTARMTGRDFFSLFERKFLHGGVWSQQQEDDATPVVVISENISNKLFGTSNSVGKLVYLDDFSARVVGVLQDWQVSTKFYDLNNGAFNTEEELFLPFSLVAAQEIDTWGNTNGWRNEPNNTFKDKLQSERVWLQFWVELADDQQKRDYQDFLMAYMQEQQKRGRFNREQLQYSLRDVNQWMEYNEVVSEDNKIMVGLSALFLMVCLANILGLLLAKFLRRAPDVGVRRALGASKTQVFYQHLVEVALLGVLGGLGGILFTQLGLWGIRVSYRYYSGIATMDLSMFLAAPIIAIGSCILAGLYPAWLVCRTNPAIYLKTQ